MKVIFAGLKYEYGRPGLGYSTIEYRNFFGTLVKMEDIEAEFFAIDEIMAAVGRDEMNRRLIDRVEETKPDLLFCFLFTEELKKETIAHITQKTNTKTFNWFADDHWRFPIFSKAWAPLFTAVSTTDSEAIHKYHNLGIDNVIKTQWAANTNLFKPSELQVESEKLQDLRITFVGKNYGKRGEYIQDLKNHQLPAEGYGKGWPSGVVGEQDMIKIFSSSKINLNFTESYFDWTKELAKLFIKKELGSIKFNFHHFFNNLRAMRGKFRRQIKARIFEVPATGGFLLTGDADNLQEYYIPGKEIEIFRNFDELREKCEYYLEHNKERQAIAQAGYQRTIREHTYKHRFQEIFKAMGLM